MIKHDMRDIAAAGANCVRFYYHPEDASQEDWEEMLDICSANGIDVILFRWISHSLDYSLATGQANRQVAIDQMTGMVSNMKGHPAIVGWGFGNENTHAIDDADEQDKKDFYVLLNDCIAAAKLIDTTRFYTHANAEYRDVLLYGNGLVPNIDVWGFNVYRGTGLGPFPTFARMATQKPMIFTEFGIRRWDNVRDQEQEQKHADVNLNLAKLIESEYPLFSGHLVFRWVDRWDAAGNLFEHDADGAEYTGSTEAVPVGYDAPRPKKQLYNQLSSYFNNIKYPATKRRPV